MSIDKEMFKEIYDNYNGLFYMIGKKILYEDEQVKDALQQCWMRILRNLEKIRALEADKRESYLTRIMKNEAIRIYNYNKTINSIQQSFDERLYEIGDFNINIEEIIIQMDIQTEMKACLEQLNEEDRDLIVLKFYLDLKNNEIADALGLDIKSLGWRIFRAKEKLSKIIRRKGI